jgi:hypothetical protein
MHGLDLEAFRSTRLTREPFDYLVVPGFVTAGVRAAVNADFPPIDSPGSFPAQVLRCGPAFAALLDALTGPEVRAAFEDKFQIDLAGRPTLLTVRGRCDARDGRIHTDAASKLITALIYLNPAWEGRGGCLRLLRSADDLEDVLVEVPPLDGTLVAFRRSDNSYHGHKPFIGPRRVIQLNWVTDRLTVRRELLRHRASAWVKRLLGLVRRRGAAL